MLKARVIPCLLLKEQSLVKTVNFNKFGYIGDPVNTCRIFNELEVDELTFLDIRASIEGRGPNFKILQEISDECFMPVSYGGGISDITTAEKIFKIGFEKVVINSSTFTKPGLISDIAKHFGNQSVIAAIDVKKNLFGKYQVYGFSGTKSFGKTPPEWAKELESKGAGEILLTSIDREGTWKGFDEILIKSVTEKTAIPVIAHGGAGKPEDINSVIKNTGASAVGLGSMVVYQGKDLGVLVNFPDRNLLNI